MINGRETLAVYALFLSLLCGFYPPLFADQSQKVEVLADSKTVFVREKQKIGRSVLEWTFYGGSLAEKKIREQKEREKIDIGAYVESEIDAGRNLGAFPAYWDPKEEHCVLERIVIDGRMIGFAPDAALAEYGRGGVSEDYEWSLMAHELFHIYAVTRVMEGFEQFWDEHDIYLGKVPEYWECRRRAARRGGPLLEQELQLALEASRELDDEDPWRKFYFAATVPRPFSPEEVRLIVLHRYNDPPFVRRRVGLAALGEWLHHREGLFRWR